MDTGKCYNYCDGYFGDGAVAYTNENSPVFDVYVPECAARIAEQAAAAYVADAFLESNPRDRRCRGAACRALPFSMFRTAPRTPGAARSPGR